MKIAKIEALPLMAALEKPIRMPQAVIHRFYTTIVRITTDDGIMGVGECIVRMSPNTTKTIVEELLAPIVLGRDPLDVEAIWWDMFQSMRGRGHHAGFMIEAISGIDTALWDIMGKYHKMSIGKLLGGYDRKQVPVYASSVMLGEPLDMQREAEMLVERGYRAIKVKIGRGRKMDVEIIKAIRHAVGEDVDLMVDANSCYDAGTAVMIGKALEEYGVVWFEEPVPADDVRGYEQISQKLCMQIAAGESVFTSYGIRQLLEKNCVDIVQPDVSRVGGITESRKVANLALAFNKQYAPHTGFSSSICVFASLQLAAYAVNFSLYEYMYIDNPLQHILNIPTPKVTDGLVSIPQGEGLCAEIDEKSIAKYLL